MSVVRRLRWIAAGLASGPAIGAAAQIPPVYLNHVVVVLDSATYAASNRSPFLTDTLGRLAQYTIQGGGGASWTGSYLFGRNTYVELFPPGGIAGPAGIGMISYGVEEPGSLWRIRDRLGRATNQPIDSLLRNRARATGEVPWFYAVSVHGVLTGSALPTWVMEYHPQYNQLWDHHDGILRSEALASEYDAKLALRDVIGVTVAVNDVDRRRILAEAAALGYRALGESRLVGPRVVIQLEPATSTRRGVTAVELELGRTLPSGERAIGPRSRIAVTRPFAATWRFQ